MHPKQCIIVPRSERFPRIGNPGQLSRSRQDSHRKSAGRPVSPGAPGLAFETWESNERNPVARKFEFEKAARLRDSIKELREKEFLFG